MDDQGLTVPGTARSPACSPVAGGRRGRGLRAILRHTILTTLYLAGRPGSRSASKRQGRPRKILVVRPDHLGDVLLSYPAIKALRNALPESQIVLAAGPWSEDIAKHNEDVDAVRLAPFPAFERAPRVSPLAPYSLLLKTAAGLRKQGFDAAINLRNDFWWGAALVYLAKIPHRVGYATPESERFLTSSLPFTTSLHATDQSLALVDELCRVLGLDRHLGCARPFDPVFSPAAGDIERARRILAQHGLDLDSGFAVVHPGAGARIKLWTVEGFAGVVRLLADAHGLRVAITGSEAERPLAEAIAGRSRREVVILAGQQSVGELAAVLSLAKLAVGVDSGPLHLAAAVGTPTVHLFGPSDPLLYGPRGDPGRHLVVRAGMPCVPCRDLSDRPQWSGGGECLAAVTVDSVREAVESLLREVER